MDDEHPTSIIIADYHAAMDMSNGMSATARYAMIMRAYLRQTISFMRMNQSIALVANEYIEKEI